MLSRYLHILARNSKDVCIKDKWDYQAAAISRRDDLKKRSSDQETHKGKDMI